MSFIPSKQDYIPVGYDRDKPIAVPTTQLNSLIKVILYSYSILKKMNERITDS